MPKLVVPATIVIPFLEWLQARGREIYLRPVPEYVRLIWLRQDHLEWHIMMTEALRRAFDDVDPLFAQHGRVAAGICFDTSVVGQLAEFRADVARELAVLEDAIALARGVE